MMLSSNHRQPTTTNTSGNRNKNQKQHNNSRRNRKVHIYVSAKHNEEEQSTNTTNTTTTAANAYATTTTAELAEEKPSTTTSTTHHDMNTMTTKSAVSCSAEAETQYKWTQLATTLQSAFEFLAKLVLTTVLFLWNWTSNVVLHYLSSSEINIFNSLWNYILATMTIEIVTTTLSTENGSNPNSANNKNNNNNMDSTTITTLTSCVPVLRLNSVTMDEEVEQFHHFSKGGMDSVLLEDDEDKLDAGIDCGSDFVQSNSSNYNSSDGEQDTIIFTDDENSNSDNNRALTTSLASTLEFLEKQSQQQQLYASRRDSDSSCDGSADVGIVGDTKGGANEDNTDSAVESSEDIETKIIKQVEYMFSDDHLAKDGFLLKHVRRRSDGFVSLKLVAGLRKVKQISKEFNVVVDALRKSTKVEVNHDGSKVRRVDPLTPTLKSLPIASSNKDKNGNDNVQNKPRQGRNSLEQQQLSDSELAKCMRAHVQLYNNNNNNNYQRRSQRFSNASMTSGSSVSPASSACSSRNGSFSYQQHPGGDLFNRNHYYGPAGTDLDGLEQVLLRRRGGSLPINAAAHQQQKRHSHSSATGNQLQLSPSSSPPSSGTFAPGQHRPKSNSYCEGANITNGSSAGVGMSAWLQKRLASSRTSEGNISVAATVIRQPRGPDGTKGFAAGYRNMIAAERQVRERKIGQQMI